MSKGKIDTSEQEVGQDSSRLMKSTGAADKSLEPSRVELVDRPVDKEKLAMLAFMDEPVTIRLATTTDREAEQMFELNINGQLAFFRRGETKTVKRYFVDRLARLKETAYSQKEVVNAVGIRDILHIPHSALKYDFSVINDPNPRGADWLTHVLAEA
jgi:hypothetical protein